MNSAPVRDPPDRVCVSSRGRPAPNEEPELNNERDIPTDADDAEPVDAPVGGGVAAVDVVASKESVAGEEDPGAALDVPDGSP